jgi:hypothetical protein
MGSFHATGVVQEDSDRPVIWTLNIALVWQIGVRSRLFNAALVLHYLITCDERKVDAGRDRLSWSMLEEFYDT